MIQLSKHNFINPIHTVGYVTKINRHASACKYPWKAISDGSHYFKDELTLVIIKRLYTTRRMLQTHVVGFPLSASGWIRGKFNGCGSMHTRPAHDIQATGLDA